MDIERQVIALAGVGHLGRYVCEELIASPDFDVIVLTRQRSQNDWLSSKAVRTFTTDYTVPSILTLLNDTAATTLISFINLADTRYITVHSALLDACQQSSRCKRLIPSEWIGDIEAYPSKPDFYATTRLPFRDILRAQDAVTWTLFNQGWLADYFLPSSKTHMKPIPDEFPVDPNAWTACVRGTGDEEQSWTCGRDVAKAVVELCRASDWEQVTYVAAEWSTFNAAIRVMESSFVDPILRLHQAAGKQAHRGLFPPDRPMPRTSKSWPQIQSVLEAHAGEKELSEELELAQVEEMMVMSYLACPKEATLRHREKYFRRIHFRPLRELLQAAGAVDFI
ncbi:MAG: hypothetical protein LQ344_007307 [Seirophora lacunosa]|nr:MAG: hypothetical protein LQ344_007307 [Seirophora lacunosa]